MREVMLFTLHGKVTYQLRILPKAFWFIIFLPYWHGGRGYYISIGVWLFAIYREY